MRCSWAGPQERCLTMAANLAMMSGDGCLLDRRRNRLETSSLGMPSSPQDRQMDTAFVDHADWKLSLGPTCTLQLRASLLMMPVPPTEVKAEMSTRSNDSASVPEKGMTPVTVESSAVLDNGEVTSLKAHLYHSIALRVCFQCRGRGELFWLICLSQKPA